MEGGISLLRPAPPSLPKESWAIATWRLKWATNDKDRSRMIPRYGYSSTSGTRCPSYIWMGARSWEEPSRSNLADFLGPKLRRGPCRRVYVSHARHTSHDCWPDEVGMNLSSLYRMHTIFVGQIASTHTPVWKTQRRCSPAWRWILLCCSGT